VKDMTILTLKFLNGFDYPPPPIIAIRSRAVGRLAARFTVAAVSRSAVTWRTGPRHAAYTSRATRRDTAS
jgi:hypothetical protein